MHIHSHLLNLTNETRRSKSDSLSVSLAVIFHVYKWLQLATGVYQFSSRLPWIAQSFFKPSCDTVARTIIFGLLHFFYFSQSCFFTYWLAYLRLKNPLIFVVPILHMISQCDIALDSFAFGLMIRKVENQLTVRIFKIKNCVFVTVAGILHSVISPTELRFFSSHGYAHKQINQD